MKTRSTFALAGLLLTALALPASAADTVKTYTNRYFLYSVDHPEIWRVKESGKVAAFYSPLASEDDKFADNVQIVAEDLSKIPASVTLVDYHRKGVANARKYLNDFKVLEEASTRWLDRETIVMLYTATMKGERFKFKDYKFMAGKTAYVLTYCATTSDFDTYLPAAERLMRSIRVSP